MSRKKGEDRLLVALAAGQTITAAARLAGVSIATAKRRLHDPEFRRRVSEMRGELIEQAAGRLAETAAEAVSKLRELLGAESETVRLGAARSLLELAFKCRELQDFDQRLTKLEERLHATSSETDQD
jgi:HEAT repeat protein